VMEDVEVENLRCLAWSNCGRQTCSLRGAEHRMILRTIISSSRASNTVGMLFAGLVVEFEGAFEVVELVRKWMNRSPLWTRC
jgi:hypothetical protein